MTFALPRLSFGSPPYVQKGARSAHYELVKLVEGEIDGVFAVEGLSGFVVAAHYNFWRFDAQGRLVDFSSRTDVGPHGESFKILQKDSAAPWQAFRSDWLLTGDPALKEIPIEPLPPEDSARLLQELGKAEHFFEVVGGGIEKGWCHGFAVKNDGRWRVLDLSRWEEKKRINLPYTKKKTEDRGNRLWTTCSWDRLKTEPPCVLDRGTAFWAGDSLSPLSLTGFSRRSIGYDEGFGAWLFWNTFGWILFAGYGGRPPSAYWNGVSTFSLHQGNEELRFRASAFKAMWTLNPPNAANLRVLDFPGGVRLLRVVEPGKEHDIFNERYAGSGDRAHDEVGLYMVREIPAPPANALQGHWLPAVRGLSWTHSGYPKCQVDFEDGSRQLFADVPDSVSESQFDMPRGGRVLPQPFRQIPSRLRLHLPLSYDSFAPSIPVAIGGKRWLFLAREADPVLDVALDTTEFVKAWKELGGGDLKLVADFIDHKERVIDEGEKPDHWVEPRLLLAKGTRTVVLKRCRWSDPKLDGLMETKRHHRYLDFRHYQAGRLARAGKLAPEDWIESTRGLIRENVSKEYGPWLIQQANDLLNGLSKSNDAKTGHHLIDFWMDELFPVLHDDANAEFLKASEILTSNSLGNSLNWNDTALTARILAKLVNPNQEAIRHGTLHFNLACHHSRQKDKPAMLASIRRGLQRGKHAYEYRNDPDFAPWLKDPDFLKVLEGK
jgi:hypothetical protein